MQGNYHVIVVTEYPGVQHSMNIRVSSIMKLTTWYSVKSHGNRDFAFFVFERTKHQPRRNLRSY